MGPLSDLSEAFTGWAEIVAGKPEAATRFHADVRGVIGALLAVLVAVLLSFAAQSAVSGLPGPGQIVVGLVLEALIVLALALTIRQTLRFLKLDVPPLILLVPAYYALAFMFVAAIPLAVLGPGGSLIALLGLLFLLFRAGRTLAGMKTGVALAFAALCAIVLVIVPNGLYMLLSLFQPSA